jgi:hypothetical protein
VKDGKLVGMRTMENLGGFLMVQAALEGQLKDPDRSGLVEQRV